MSKENQENTYEFQGTGLTVKERNIAAKTFNKYKNNYNITKLSDLELLSEKVFREVLQEKTKEKIGQVMKAKKDKLAIVPKHLLDSLNDNLEQILKIDEKLGLFTKNKETDPFKYIEILKKKFKKWREQNPDRYITCPHCSESILLMIKPEHYIALKHPFYKNNIVYNEHTFKLLKEGKITELDAAKILLGSTTQTADYVKWVLQVVIPSFSNLPVPETE